MHTHRSQLHPEGLGGVERPGDSDEDLDKVSHDSLIARVVRIDQRAPGHGSPDAHVIEPGLHRAEAGLDVAQALAVGQVGEGQTDEQVETREATDLVVALLATPAATELGQRQEIHHMREDRSADMHGPLLR